jgi:hypothetical protein
MKWIGLLVLATVGFSCGFGCAVPLAAFGAVAALTLRPGGAAAAVGLVWLVNQVWQGAVLGAGFDARWAAGLLALALACAAAPRWVRGRGPVGWVDVAACFGVAFGVYEGGLWALAWALGGSTAVFALPLLASALGANAGVFAVLLGARRLIGGSEQGVQHHGVVDQVGHHAEFEAAGFLE